MSTIEVTVPDDLLRIIDERALERGSDRGQVIRDIIDGVLRNPTSSVQTFDAILAPIRQGFAESGMSEHEALEMLQSELKAVRAERQQSLH